MPDERERLAALEREVQTIKEMLVRMEKKMDAQQENYATRSELSEMLRIRDIQIEHLNNRLITTEANQTWLWRSVAGAVIVAVMATLWFSSKHIGGV